MRTTTIFAPFLVAFTMFISPLCAQLYNSGQFFVDVGAVLYVKDTLQNNAAAIFINNGTVSAGGAFINNASITGTGKVVLSGTLPQNVLGTGALTNLEVNSAGVTILPANMQDVTGTLVLTAGTLTANRGLTLKSTDVSTARVAPVVSGSEAGDVIVERYIPARRAWRILAAPVEGSQTINNAWQEGALTTASNPVPNFGTFITGGIPANGFDQNPGATSSIKAYNSAVNNWGAVPNTIATPVNANAYMTFVYGNRNTNTISTSAIPGNTTLRSTGPLKIGDQTFPVNPTGFTGIPNPYASPIDFATITRNNVANNFYLWDPKMGGTYGVGAYVTVSWNGSSYDVSSTAVSPESQYIQSGQGFLVSSTGGPGSIIIKESDKSTTAPTNVFRSAERTAPVSKFEDPTKGQGLRISLQSENEDKTTSVLDESFSSFRIDYKGKVDALDAVKAENLGENLGIVREGQTLVIERKPLPSESDTIALKLWNTVQKRYLFEFNPVNLGATGLRAYLEDKYLRSLTNISLSKISSEAFTITGNAASSRADRFSIVFSKNGKRVGDETTNSINISNIVAYPNPVTGRSVNLQFNNEPEGVYQVKIISSTGQVMLERSVQHGGGSAVQGLVLDKVLGSGIYQLQITGPDTKNTLQLIFK